MKDQMKDYMYPWIIQISEQQDFHPFEKNMQNRCKIIQIDLFQEDNINLIDIDHLCKKDKWLIHFFLKDLINKFLIKRFLIIMKQYSRDQINILINLIRNFRGLIKINR